jgi:hypothetical protein
MTITCPACGGASLRELTPGFYECMSPIDAWISPGVASSTGWPHGSRPCGHRFQVGLALATEPCWCGRHSIGRCRDCKRPLCGLHGTAGGELLCGECLTARADRQRAKEAEATVARDRAVEERGRDLSANVAGCSSARELLTLLRGRGAAVPDADALRSAWTRVIASEGFEAVLEVVDLAGRPLVASPLSWSDSLRRGSWSEPGQRAIVWQAPDAGGTSSSAHTNGDIWLEAQGDVWSRQTHGTLGFAKHEGPKTLHYVVARGERLRLKRGQSPYQTFHTVTGGVSVRRSTPVPGIYASVVEAALKHGMA